MNKIGLYIAAGGAYILSIWSAIVVQAPLWIKIIAIITATGLTFWLFCTTSSFIRGWFLASYQQLRSQSWVLKASDFVTIQG